MVQGFGNGPNHVEAPEIAAERHRLHEACGKAYQATGTIRSPEWQAASKALDEFRYIHGWEYNPD